MGKILFISNTLGKGGEERTVSLLSREFSKHFRVCTVIYHAPVEYEVEGELINLNVPLRTLLQKITGLFVIVKRLREIIRDKKPEFIISFVGGLPAVLAFHPVIFRIYTNPDYLSMREKLFFGSFYKMPHVKKIVAVSSGIEEKMKRKYRFKNMEVIHNPFNPHCLEEQDLARKPFEYDYILAVGRLAWEKGFDALIRAFAKTTIRGKVKLVILGKGPDRKILETLISDLCLQDRVILCGQVDFPEVYMRHAEFVVAPSRCEGFPNVLIESLACGTPVIATNCQTGPSEIITNGKNGLLVPVDDEKVLADSMDGLFNDRALLSKLRTNARESVEPLSVSRITEKWYRLFEEIRVKERT